MSRLLSFEDFNWALFWIWVLGLFIVGLIGLMFFAAYAVGSYKDKLMNECMGTGKKEFECYAMLRDPTPMVVPVATPIYVGR